MRIKINKELQAFKSDVFKGLSARELMWGMIAMVGALLIGGAVSYIFLVPIQVSVYIGMGLWAAPIILLVLRQIQGMSYLKMMLEQRYVKQTEFLIRETEVFEPVENRFQMIRQTPPRKATKNKTCRNSAQREKRRV